jgi:hypothetical protein
MDMRLLILILIAKCALNTYQNRIADRRFARRRLSAEGRQDRPC